MKTFMKLWEENKIIFEILIKGIKDFLRKYSFHSYKILHSKMKETTHGGNTQQCQKKILYKKINKYICSLLKWIKNWKSIWFILCNNRKKEYMKFTDISKKEIQSWRLNILFFLKLFVWIWNEKLSKINECMKNYMKLKIALYWIQWFFLMYILIKYFNTSTTKLKNKMFMNGNRLKWVVQSSRKKFNQFLSIKKKTSH